MIKLILIVSRDSDGDDGNDHYSDFCDSKNSNCNYDHEDDISNGECSDDGNHINDTLDK